MFYGKEPYFQSGWNIMDGSLVSVSIIDILMSLISDSSPRIFGILRVSMNLNFKRELKFWITLITVVTEHCFLLFFFFQITGISFAQIFASTASY